MEQAPHGKYRQPKPVTSRLPITGPMVKASDLEVHQDFLDKYGELLFSRFKATTP
jgi:hypothetical protein